MDVFVEFVGKNNKLKLCEKPQKRKGLAETLLLGCKGCEAVTELMTSKAVMLSSQPVPEVNIRSV